MKYISTLLVVTVIITFVQPSPLHRGLQQDVVRAAKLLDRLLATLQRSPNSPPSFTTYLTGKSIAFDQQRDPEFDLLLKVGDILSTNRVKDSTFASQNDAWMQGKGLQYLLSLMKSAQDK